MSNESEDESNDRMGRADRIRNTREGRRDQPGRRSRSAEDSAESREQSDENQSSQRSQSSQSIQTSQNSQTSQSSQKDGQNTSKQPVKQRPHRTVYLPSELDDEFESRIDRLLFEAKAEEGVQLAKNRHAYPLIVYLGLERVNDMTTDEMLDTLTETDMLDTPES